MITITSGFVFAFESIKTAIMALWNKLSTINLGFPGFTVGAIILVVFACYSTFRFLIFPALNIDFHGFSYAGAAVKEYESEKKWENRKRIGFY